MVFPKTIASVLLLASMAFNSHAQDSDYNKLSLQEKADLARYLGWVWGDGIPGFNGTGILYKGGNSNYNATVRRLAQIRIDGRTNPFGFPESGNLKHAPDVWEYWDNSLPGGNPGDPQILRDAIRHPNFLAGVMEGEGQVFHSNPNQDFYIADQSYAPSHPDKLYDIANFGPERMIQLFLLLEETYGFTNPAISIGNTKYQFNTQSCEAIERIREEYTERREQNESGNLRSGFTVKVYIKPPDFDEIRSYGFFSKGDGRFRTPAPDSDLEIINNSFPDLNSEVNGSMSFFGNEGVGTRLQHGAGSYLSSGLNIVANANNGANGNLLWELVDLNNGYYRIESQDNSISKIWLQARDDTALAMAGENSTWHLTQWEKIPVPNTNGRFYLKNRFYGTHLRVGTSSSVLKHGPAGSAAEWVLDEATEAALACAG